MRSYLVSLLPFFACGAPLAAQAVHTQLFPAVSPSPRSGLHGVSDGGGMLVFGGITVSSPATFSSEMWRFDGTNWTNLTPAVSPPGRDWYASSYDQARGRYVLFGGRVLSGTATTDANDTWEFDGTTWAQAAPAASPSARRWAAMAFDFTLGKNVLFGGSALGTTFLGDTWTWDGSNWAQLTPAVSPSPRARGWLEWDLLHARAIYYGGKNTTANLALAETWSWDGATWTQLPTANAPGWNAGNGVISFGMTYDLIRDRFVLVGGTRTTASVSPQTYEFTGSDWLLHNTGGLTARTGPATAFVAALGKTYTFGGYSGSAFLGDTFEYQTDDWAGYQVFGLGCAGPAGVVTLAETHPAWLGETHRTAIANLAPASLCFGLLGFSATSWSGGPLPFPLLLGYPNTSANCNLLVSPDTTVFLPNLGGTTEFALGLPSDPGFLGLTVHLQALQMDPTLALSASPGATIVFGAK